MAKRVPRWTGGPLWPHGPHGPHGPHVTHGPHGPLGEGGYGKVYAVNDDVVVKVVAVDGEYTEHDMFTADITKNPFREVAIYQRSNRLVAKGLTDHVALMLAARKVRKGNVRNVRALHSSSGSIRVCTTGCGAAKLPTGLCVALWRRRSTGTT
ncbi:MAG: hypothetical protein EBZ77_08925 [Chitinophagia bacterium]|nr:hypothetical protein [Chitinophagia bacterium]